MLQTPVRFVKLPCKIVNVSNCVVLNNMYIAEPCKTLENLAEPW